jgi:hypothetical protein
MGLRQEEEETNGRDGAAVAREEGEVVEGASNEET